jgi:hypothetical protein
MQVQLEVELVVTLALLFVGQMQLQRQLAGLSQETGQLLVERIHLFK